MLVNRAKYKGNCLTISVTSVAELVAAIFKNVFIYTAALSSAVSLMLRITRQGMGKECDITSKSVPQRLPPFQLHRQERHPDSLHFRF
jgi:hypothetical protein